METKLKQDGKTGLTESVASVEEDFRRRVRTGGLHVAQRKEEDPPVPVSRSLASAWKASIEAGSVGDVQMDAVRPYLESFIFSRASSSEAT